MRTIIAIIVFSLSLWASPATANDLRHQTPYNAKPKALAALNLADRRIEMLAVTRRARADTVFRRAHLDECRNMSKVMPGYPQPAFVSFDFRLKF
ncbi:hypothetical protein PUV54_04500 [Hyphococcus flavus]|uniref:UrcA family protein n=1 Tax=Hyphococcus flavus TaxID=1866326 RepID=A0AAE9ZCM9_9PROT|nr:hypothetical protein [Hyphococcus flavus]WDI32453.1 hypothetical protein PUV54_04500 [Hyphococcus flavus]